jgi:hypothetical protein
MRRLASWITSSAKADLGLIADHETNVTEYRDAFYRLGGLLADRLQQARLGKNILLVCTSEDADFLARGILESILDKQRGAPAKVALACFWQARFRAIQAGSGQESVDVAPIMRRYEEPTTESLDSLIIVKSIISSSCVVRHALLDVMGRKQPKKIFIAAPVILRGAPIRLRKEFPKEISRRFEFFYFAEDDEKDETGNVLPGIGGSVYERLGLTEPARLTPRLVIERRKAGAD